MIYTVVCTDINDYINWQFELLEYSWSRIKQPGKLMRLVACDESAELPVHKHAEVYRTRPTNTNPDTGDIYVCYNRLYSLQQWLEAEDIQGTILIVDADVVFRSAIKESRPEGTPLGQHWFDFGLGGLFLEAAQATTDVDLDTLQPVTWPALINANDLRRLLPRWIEATVSIREQTKRQESDMLGFLVAAREQQLEFELGTTTAFMPWPEEQVAGAPIIHYCQIVEDINGQTLWGKTSYAPWERVPNAQTAKLPYCRDLLEILDEFARLKAVAEQHTNDTIFIAIASYCEPELLDTIQSCLDNARHPQNLRFGICLQYDDSNPLTSHDCLDRFAEDNRFRYVTYPYSQSRGGCWARNIAQRLYADETYTLQIDAHTQMIESWDSLLIEMMQTLPAEKPLITQFPPLYTIDDGEKNFHLVEDLSQVNTAIAEQWIDEGYLVHRQQLIPENNKFPRFTRVLSGAFVFTLGQWNKEVRQDPDHFYTGEEFALAVRSFTHGYDLFDPNQVVCWHRSHPEPNRKFWNDNAEEITKIRHDAAIRRLNQLFTNDEALGRYGRGTSRTLEEYATFSGIDCINKTLTPAAMEGQRVDMNWANEPMTNNTLPETIVDVTINLVGREPLLLSCYENTPVLLSLFVGLQRKSIAPDDSIYLQLGEQGEEQICFRASQLLSIQTNPALSSEFFAQLSAQTAALASEHPQTIQTSDQPQAENPLPQAAINDNWKIWIWSCIARGVTKEQVFKQMLEKGFTWPVIREELSYEPNKPLGEIVSVSASSSMINVYQENPIATRLETDKFRLYHIENFLNADECNTLIEIARKNLRPSFVTDNVETAGVVSEVRTSNTCMFDRNKKEHELAFEVTKRLAKVIGINPNYAESLQAQIYGVGGEYKAHFDWFEPGTPSFAAEAHPDRGGQRTWSVIVYLNDVSAGGETRFENINTTILPSPGRVVFWENLDDFGAPNHDVLHQACPVLEGEKAILTLWFRSLGEGEMYQREVHELLPRYTEAGIKKGKLSKSLFRELSDFYICHDKAAERDEDVSGDFLRNENEPVPSTLIDIPEELKQKIITELQPECERWSQQSLNFSALYGIRVYKRGTTLEMHTDTDTSHIISVIINVNQQVDQAWPLEVIDHVERPHSVFLEPGEVLLYEGARLRHGRPTPLDGDSFANIFLHFRPQ